MTNETPDEVGNREDELLAVRCQLGEMEAFDALVERWHPALRSYLRKMTGDEEAAAELVQETWLRVLRGLPRLRNPARLRPWLFGIARRVVMDRLRERYATQGGDGSRNLSLDATAESPARTPDEMIDPTAAIDTTGLTQEIEAMRGELGALPVTERETLTLFYLHELSLTEVAEIQAVPTGTVKSRLNRARRMLRERLTERGYE